MARKLSLASLAAAALALAAGAPARAAEPLPLVAGVVKSVEADRLTIAHEAIPNLGVGEATMIFRAVSADIVHNLRAGEKVRFSAMRMNGQATITSLVNESALMSGESCE